MTTPEQRAFIVSIVQEACECYRDLYDMTSLAEWYQLYPDMQPCATLCLEPRLSLIANTFADKIFEALDQ